MSDKTFQMGVSFLVGYLIGNRGGGIPFLFFMYGLSVWGVRSAIAAYVNSVAIRGSYLKSIMDVRDNNRFFDDPTIIFEYNAYSNTLFVKKNLTSRIMHDKEEIDRNIRKVFNMVLCWDIFYHYNPLTITHQ